MTAAGAARARPASALTMDRPAGATSSQCRPQIRRPWSSAVLAKLDGLCIAHPHRVLGQREGRHLQPVVAQGGRQLALLREGQRLQHFVARANFMRLQRGSARRTAGAAAASRSSTASARCTPHSTAEIGRVKKGSEVAVGQHQAAAEVLLQQVAQHDAQHQRRHRDSRSGAARSPARRRPPSPRCRTGARPARRCRSCTAPGCMGTMMVVGTRSTCTRNFVSVSP